MSGQPPTAAPPALSEVLRLQAQLHALKVENAQLRALLADSQAQLASAELSVERARVEQAIRQALGCAADAPIDWTMFAPGAPADPATRACAPAPATSPDPQ